MMRSLLGPRSLFARMLYSFTATMQREAEIADPPHLFVQAVETNAKHATIVGAGMGGSLLAIFLAQRGYRVDIFECRDNIQSLPSVSYRSINQSLSAHGIDALKSAGIWEHVKTIAAPEHGRVIHQAQGELYEPYGNTHDRTEWSVNRNDLNRVLIEETKRYPQISIHAHQRCVSVSLEKRTITLEDEITKVQSQRTVDMLIGADGVNSKVRAALVASGISNVKIDYLEWGYKNIYIRPRDNASLPFRGNAFHLWSKKTAAIFGIPNKDGFFTCTVTLPLKGPDSFESLSSKESLLSFFETNFPDLYEFIPEIADELVQQPTTAFASVYTSKWNHDGFATLLGDACHAMTIFYGQGINAAFEDCRVLAQSLDEHYPNISAAFSAYERSRKPNVDLLTTLCRDRFTDLKDRYESTWFNARTHVEMKLEKWFPNAYRTLYTLIVHTTIPTADAYALYKRQRRIARLLGMDIAVALVALSQRMNALRLRK